MSTGVAQAQNNAISELIQNGLAIAERLNSIAQTATNGVIEELNSVRDDLTMILFTARALRAEVNRSVHLIPTAKDLLFSLLRRVIKLDHRQFINDIEAAVASTTVRPDAIPSVSRKGKEKEIKESRPYSRSFPPDILTNKYERTDLYIHQRLLFDVNWLPSGSGQRQSGLEEEENDIPRDLPEYGGPLKAVATHYSVPKASWDGTSNDTISVLWCGELLGLCENCKIEIFFLGGVEMNNDVTIILLICVYYAE